MHKGTKAYEAFTTFTHQCVRSALNQVYDAGVTSALGKELLLDLNHID